MENIARDGNFTTLLSGLTGLSGGATTYSTGASGVTFCVGGKAIHVAQESGSTTPVLDAVTGLAFPALAANQGTVWVWGYTAAGAIQLAQGSIETLNAGTFLRAPQFPILPDTVTAFAYTVAKDGATGGAFTVGTSNWNTSGMTYATVDVMTLPQRPQIS